MSSRDECTLEELEFPLYINKLVSGFIPDCREFDQCEFVPKDLVIFRFTDKTQFLDL